MKEHLNHDGRTPLYYQIYDILLAAIESGQLKAGDRVPSESDLMKTYQVSRTTVIRAVEKLTERGYLKRYQGDGTYVAFPRVAKQLNKIISFSEEMRMRGRRPTTQIISMKADKASDRLQSLMNLKAGEEVVAIKRLRYADDLVMGLQTAYLPLALCPTLEDPAALADRSLYSVLLELYGWYPVRAVEEYRIDWPTDEDAEALEQSAANPVFAVQRWAYLSDGRLMEYVESLLRADRYTLHIELGADSREQRSAIF